MPGCFNGIHIDHITLHKRTAGLYRVLNNQQMVRLNLFRSPLHWLRMGLAVLALSLLGACAGPIQTKVTNFNAWPANAAGATYSYASANPQRDELEQATYEGYVGAELERHGLRQAEPGQMGRFLVEVVASDSTRQKTVLEPVYDNQLIWSPPTRDRYGNVYHGYWRPDRFGPRYIGDREVLRTVQVNRLAVRILDTKGGGKPRPVLSTSAIYEGELEDLPDMVPYLARAAFKDFPGRNGRVEVVKFDAKSGAVITR